jgi:surface carbohydrate biosynthesis protein
MNIYIHLEVSVRELDSKLLLAVIAASRGHEVIISDKESIMKGLERKLLTPGIFHTKSLTPGKSKIIKHKKLIDIGCKITSIDEEGGLVDYGYKRFAKVRYGNETITQASAIFTWGLEDYKTLKKFYPQHSKKIHLTGSARADLWKPTFSNYWKKNFKKQKKPYLLIPSAFGGGFTVTSMNERIKNYDKGQYFYREKGLTQKILIGESEQCIMISYFIEAIKYLAYKNKNFDIILRPHPSESVETWKIVLNRIPNVKVIRDDGVSLWIKNAFAMMHYSCTPALEASLFRIPLVTYSPFKAKFERKLANDLGQKVTTLNQLKKKINKIFHEHKTKKVNNLSNPLPKILLNKILIDEKETSALKTIKVWENIDDGSLIKKNNWLLFKFGLKIMKFNGLLGKFFKNESKINKYHKFPPFEKYIILSKIDKLRGILKIKQKIDCELLSDRTILIRQK